MQYASPGAPRQDARAGLKIRSRGLRLATGWNQTPAAQPPTTSRLDREGGSFMLERRFLRLEGPLTLLEEQLKRLQACFLTTR